MKLLEPETGRLTHKFWKGVFNGLLFVGLIYVGFYFLVFWCWLS